MNRFAQRRARSRLLFLIFAVSSCFGQTRSKALIFDFGSPSSATAFDSTNSDSAYLEDAAHLAKLAQRTPQPQNANVVSLADVTIERMAANGQVSDHVQQVFYIANEHGAREYGTRMVQYSENTQQLTMIHGRVYKNDDRVLEAVDAGEAGEGDAKSAMHYDTQSRQLRFPSLEKGDVVELEYRISPNSTTNPFGNYFGALIAFQNDLPQQLHRYVLIAPTSLTLNIAQERMPAMKVTMSKRTTIYSWEMRDLPPLSTEPRGPSLTEVAPYVSISTFGDWSELGKWYAAFIRPQFALDGELRRALARTISTAPTEIDKIHAIHQFVLRNTRYEAMEFGTFRYKPYPVSQVYERHFGDCKDKASLMIALLRAVGIDAELALVRTRKLGDVSERATSIAIFDHAVAYIPKYDLWLDGTAEYAGFRELPLDDQGAMALTVSLKGGTALRRIPVTAPMENYTHRVVRAQVQPDGNIVFSGLAYTRGEDAPGLRREYEVASRQRDTMRANLAQAYPTVQVASIHVEGTHDLEHDIDVNFSGSIDTFAGKSVLRLMPSWLPHKYVNSLAPLASRIQELQLPAPWTTEEELHFALPAGSSLDHMPADWTYQTQFGTASIHYQLGAGELSVTTSVQFRKLRIEPAEYAGFREFCQNVEKAFHEEIRVRLAGKALATPMLESVAAESR